MEHIARQAVAWLIITTTVGAIVEAFRPDGRLARAPIVGAAVIGVGAAITWAVNELELDGQAATDT